MTDPRAILAAANNADLYQAVFQAQSIPYRRMDFAFVAGARPPPYYSDVTVQQPGHREEIRAVLDEVIDRSSGRAGMKDSFCEIDAGAFGLSELFSAEWIWRAPTPCASDWQRVNTAKELAKWEASWRTGSPTDSQMFPPSLLARDDVMFLADETCRAGCIANISEACIGMSNVFSLEGTSVLSNAADAVGALAPDLPIVGYESGPTLDAALNCGFEACGTLRILVPASTTP